MKTSRIIKSKVINEYPLGGQEWGNALTQGVGMGASLAPLGPWGMVAGFVGGTAMSLINAGKNKVPDQADPVKAYQGTTQPTFGCGGKFPFGGTAPAELERQEVTQDPQGNMMQLDGPPHSQGGIKMNLQPGTKIFSDRLKATNGKTFAENTAKIMGQKSKYQKVLDDTNSTLIQKNTAKKMLTNLEAQTQEQFMEQEAQKFGELDNQLQQFAKGGTVKEGHIRNIIKRTELPYSTVIRAFGKYPKTVFIDNNKKVGRIQKFYGGGGVDSNPELTDRVYNPYFDAAYSNNPMGFLNGIQYSVDKFGREQASDAYKPYGELGASGYNFNPIATPQQPIAQQSAVQSPAFAVNLNRPQIPATTPVALPNNVFADPNASDPNNAWRNYKYTPNGDGTYTAIAPNGKKTQLTKAQSVNLPDAGRNWADNPYEDVPIKQPNQVSIKDVLNRKPNVIMDKSDSSLYSTDNLRDSSRSGMSGDKKNWKDIFKTPEGWQDKAFAYSQFINPALNIARGLIDKPKFYNASDYYINPDNSINRININPQLQNLSGQRNVAIKNMKNLSPQQAMAGASSISNAYNKGIGQAYEGKYLGEQAQVEANKGRQFQADVMNKLTKQGVDQLNRQVLQGKDRLIWDTGIGMMPKAYQDYYLTKVYGENLKGLNPNVDVVGPYYKQGWLNSGTK